MHIERIPIFMDNYAWLIVDESTSEAALVDPAEPGPCLAAVERSGARLVRVLSTHHHFDHTGGNEAIKAAHPSVEIVGGRLDAEKIPALDRALDDGDEVSVGSLRARVLLTPCHTRGHVSYLIDDALFCGDVLFVGGCGRFFEGDASDMHHSLNEVLAGLPASTRVYCGHEYTVSNLEFAAHVEPDNEAIARKLAWAREEVAGGGATVPSTIGEELETNPFMRVSQVSVQQAVGSTDPVAVMRMLRERKNAF